MARHLFICNPTAGRGLGARRIAELEALARARSIDCDIRVTDAAGEARDLARREAASYELVAALGGDGTIQEVAGGLAEARLSAPLDHAGSFAAFGILPAGTGNDLVRTLGLPRRFPEACARLLPEDGVGQRRDLDLGRIRWRVADDELPRERIFVNNVGLGFEGQVGWEANRIRLPLRGTLLYLVALLRVLNHLRNPDLAIGFEDGERLDGPALLLSIGLGKSSGGGFVLNPDADPFDGLLDVCHIAAVGRLRVLRFLPRAMRGTHGGLKWVTSRRATLIEVASDTPCHGHADGELLGDRIVHARLEVLPGLLPLVF